jgi:hypothetical protein
MTLDAIADLICADNSDERRTAAEIEAFLQRAYPGFPRHEEGSRKRSLLSRLQSCNDADPSDPFVDDLTRERLQAVIARLAHPLEYQGDEKRIAGVLASLNRILAPEGLVVTMAGATPYLQEVAGHIISSSTPAKDYTCPDFNNLAQDQDLIVSLQRRWSEAQKCMTAQAYLAAVLLLGSVLEGVLLAIIKRQPADANRSERSPKDAQGRVKNFREWTLHDCIEVAFDCRWLHGDRLRFSHALRESRNLIHPHQQIALREWPNESSCGICWEVVNAAIADLLAVQSNGM